MKTPLGKILVAVLWAAAPIAGLTLLAVAEPPPGGGGGGVGGGGGGGGPPVSVPSNTIPAQGTQPADVRKDKPKDGRPRLDRLIRELQETKTYLEKAPHDFGGHRPEALKAVNDAIKHLGEAAKFDLPPGKQDKGDAKGKDHEKPRNEPK